uniref:Cytochrome c oxidase subunit 2 n=1 Tax=Dipseudopsis sp. XG-2021 TaxID=2996733 RepID=A0A9E8LNS8_9NEOP|nr:cytochrome c oxidase subunit II [Dipseudopsis sp. XG-2021]
MISWSMMNIQNSNSPLMEQLTFFHDTTMFILCFITIFILLLFTFLINNKFSNLLLTNNQLLETIWTVIPSIFLVFIALPSLHILYLMDNLNSPMISLKIMGHQWFWSYEYSNFSNLSFDSYMMSNNKISNFRLLETDNRITLPFKTYIRCLISAADVIHAWTIPSLGIKSDAIPGRLNQTSFLMLRPGMFFGQCSEICGTNHSFMPICIESINLKQFTNWVKNF